ncbi:hypothetical protein C8J57DRAFT_713589 [Mycena rebaudengoi]|nr:hypothetical protein C8J57DRAFT_1716073 [Mycena rebaudengoi]KAJ7285335.1 hypothetical protein C8J57DRAFT_713589 [Mycena rebaudengoi]
MPNLLDLSPELMEAILDILAPDSPALDSLCLAGNHNLLALTQPYTWRELNVTLSSFEGDDRGASSTLASRFEAFYADPVKTAAARSLNITVAGVFDSRAPAVFAFLKDAHKLVNVTHLSLDGLESRAYSESPGTLIRRVLKSLPRVRSLNVECCESRNRNEYEGMEDPLAPNLVHIATRLSGHGLGYFLQYCPNIQVLELEGGDIFEYWCKNTKKDASNATRRGFDDTSLTPLSSFIYHNENLPNTLRKLNIIAHSFDILCISDFFEIPEPPAVLKEVFIDMPMRVTVYQNILRGIRGPVIERLAVTSPAVVKNFVNVIQNLSGDDTFFSAFESLEEFWIPWGGVLETASDDPEAHPVLAELLSHAPALKHLYFDAPENTVVFMSAAKTYASSISTLESVSWKARATHRVLRGAQIQTMPLAYSGPAWQAWTGVGKWWETSI